MVLTAVLADATKLGLTRMAEACSVASYKQLAWTAGWHVSEDAYGRALARIVAAQQVQPLAAHFGSGTASSSDGQHFPLGGRGEGSDIGRPFGLRKCTMLRRPAAVMAASLAFER